MGEGSGEGTTAGDSSSDAAQSFAPAALRAGVKLLAGKEIKVSVIGVSGRPLSGGRKPRVIADVSADATGAGSGVDDVGGVAAGSGSSGLDSDGTGPGEGMDIEWTFRKLDGTPLADQQCTVVAQDGTKLTGKLAGGVLKMRVPAGHLIVEVDGHIIANVEAA